MRILAWTESLLGYGHALRTINALHLMQPSEAYVLSGSIAASQFLRQELRSIRLIELPPLSEADVRRPYSAIAQCGVPIDDMFAMRLKIASDSVSRLRPDVVIIEHFPFGRHGFAPELLPFLEWIKSTFPSCRVVGSVRDIPRTRPFDSRKHRTFLEAARFFDRLLVHGHRSFFSVERACGLPLTVALDYTGFIPPPTSYGRNLSAPWLLDLAGGWGSEALFESVSVAARMASVHLRVVSGRHRAMCAEDEGTGLVTFVRDRGKADAGVRDTCLSIARAGYNSGLDILLSDAPAIVIPHQGSDEQQHRARILSSMRRAPTVRESDVLDDPTALLRAVPIAEEWADKWDRRQVHPLLADGATLRTAMTRS